MSALMRRSSIDLVATCAPHDLRECLKAARPEVILFDANTPATAVAAVDLAVITPSAHVVAYALDANDEESIVSLYELGVCGFVSRNASTDQLALALKSAALGDLHFSSDLAVAITRQLSIIATAKRRKDACEALSEREAQIAALLYDRLSNKEVAQRLGIQLSTVKNHVHNILRKLMVRRRGDAAKVAHGSPRLERGRPVTFAQDRDDTGTPSPSGNH